MDQVEFKQKNIIMNNNNHIMPNMTVQHSKTYFIRS